MAKKKIQKLSLRNLTAQDLKAANERTLLSVHGSIHQLFDSFFGQTSANTVEDLDLSRSDLIDLEILAQKELKRRGLKHKVEDKLTEEAAKKEVVFKLENIINTLKKASNLTKKQDESTIEAEAGIHIHELDRSQEATLEDGAHTHLFELPDGSVVMTEMSGAHAHSMSSATEDATGVDGEHSHTIIIDGETLETHLDGEHDHEALVFNTSLDGLHSHGLEFQGQTLKSLTPGEFWAKLDKPDKEAKKRATPVRLFKLKGITPNELSKVLEVLYEKPGFSLEKDNPLLKNGEQKIVLGVNLEPNRVDLQEDVYSEQDVRLAAKKAGKTIGFMHREEAKGAVLLGDYIAKQDFVLDDELVIKGTWLSIIHVSSLSLWKKIKNDELTGLSIGGTATKEPI